MKINGIEVKGIKKAVGDYHKHNRVTIVYDCKTNMVECVGNEWYDNVVNELFCGYQRYIDIVDYIKDIMCTNDINPYMITMSKVKAVLRDYII